MIYASTNMEAARRFEREWREGKWKPLGPPRRRRARPAKRRRPEGELETRSSVQVPEHDPIAWARRKQRRTMGRDAYNEMQAIKRLGQVMGEKYDDDERAEHLAAGRAYTLSNRKLLVVADREDLENALAIFNKLLFAEQPAVKRWLEMRARLLKLKFLLPEHWTGRGFEHWSE